MACPQRDVPAFALPHERSRAIEVRHVRPQAVIQADAKMSDALVRNSSWLVPGNRSEPPVLAERREVARDERFPVVRVRVAVVVERNDVIAPARQAPYIAKLRHAPEPFGMIHSREPRIRAISS